MTAEALPECQTLRLVREGGTLFVYFNRPKARNALSLQMVGELEDVLAAIHSDRSVRVLVLRGEGGHFCAGGDVKDMASARSQRFSVGGTDPIADLNRRFGTLITRLDRAPQTTVAVVEGAAMGGGFGLVCVADVVLALETASFRLPETGLGLPPAQIAPFLVRRLGLAKARRLALTGARLSGIQARSEGLVDLLCSDGQELEVELTELRRRILRCAPVASAETKRLLLACGELPHEELLDLGAAVFSAAARSPEGMEGVIAFIQKKSPSWVEEL
jgi:isohexenylglutaconyl-CoA hydratase